MARIRTIKPEFFRHPELYEAEKLSGYPLRVAFAGLWTVADRDGRFRWTPRTLKLDCLPFDDVDFELVMEALERNGFIKRYAIQGVAYGCIPSWACHQVVNVREQISKIPDISRADTFLHVHAHTTPVQENGEREGKGREKEKEGKRITPLSASTIPPLSAGFQEFWNEWPAGERKVGKVKANQFWKREKLEARTDEIVALVAAWKLTEKWTAGFCPQPMTWLNGRQYEDGLPHAEPPRPMNAQQQRDIRSAQLRGELPYDAKADFLNEIDMGLIEYGTNVQ